MKVQRFWNVWSDHRWTLIFVFVYCVQLKKQQSAWGESEISGEGRSGSTDRHAWPPMKNHDIWSDDSAYANEEYFDEDEIGKAEEVNRVIGQDDMEFVGNSFDGTASSKGDCEGNHKERRGKVLHIFPVPVDGECLSDDGRRSGSCLNPYECRQKGGSAKGECAMGFGVCCIFIANCNGTVSNNITYLVSPQFPSFMPSNFTSCTIKVKLMSEDVSQLRFDFNHFSLGQPNRRTGVCDGDIFNISGGLAGTLSLCGQNSGQHLYYDVGGRSLPRQTLYGSLRPPTLAQLYPNRDSNSPTDQLIEISMSFAQRFSPSRLWEIRISQIPFSQRAPAGCLQYHFGTEGVIQTFNFADNGRHLANQHYRVCMRQETDMCSIMYQPCDEQSFRIGPSMPFRGLMQQSPNGIAGLGTNGVGGVGPGGAPTAVGNMGIMAGVINPLMMGVMPASAVPGNPMATVGTTPLAQMMASMATASSIPPMRTTAASSSESTTNAAPASSSSASTVASSMSSSTPLTMRSSTTRATTTTTTPTTTRATTTTTPATTSTTTTTTTTVAPTRRTTPPSTTTQASTTLRATSPLSDEIEGSGDGDGAVTPPTSNVNRRPRPVRGGFDLLGFLRNAFDLGLGQRRMEDAEWPEFHRPQRQERQIFSTCSDRITLPCIIEDFIGTGLGPVPSCEPVHCGTQFCSSGAWPCRVESTVTPFFLNVHFGNGAGKGSAEDNIGACLRFTQMRCM